MLRPVGGRTGHAWMSPSQPLQWAYPIIQPGGLSPGRVPARWIPYYPGVGQIPPAVVLFTFAMGLCFGLLLRRGWRLVPATALALVGLLVITGVAFAHEGHDHAGEAKGAAAGLPRGTVVAGGLHINDRRSGRCSRARSSLGVKGRVIGWVGLYVGLSLGVVRGVGR